MSKYDELDGYLLPKYWQCIVCKVSKVKKRRFSFFGARERANWAYETGMFLTLIKDERFFGDLDQTDRAAAADHASGEKTIKQLEDTTGLARKLDGWGFDAVFLCDDHWDEVKRAIDTLGKEGSKRTKKKRHTGPA